MPVRTKRFESKGGNKVRAIKVTERNYVELLQWVFRNATNVIPSKSHTTEFVTTSGDVLDQRLRLHLRGKGIRVARVGSYVFHVLNDDLSLTDGTLYILKGDEFEDKYTEIKK